MSTEGIRCLADPDIIIQYPATPDNANRGKDRTEQAHNTDRPELGCIKSKDNGQRQ
jgi:hypothetical protein